MRKNTDGSQFVCISKSVESNSQYNTMLLSQVFYLVSITCAFKAKHDYELDFGSLGKGVGFTQDGYEDTVQIYGVPYVHSPTSSRRFKVPELKNEWGDEPLNLTVKSSYCPQLFQKARLDAFSEDCLYLNIWAPRRAIEEKLSLPVQVYFHGGAFFFGANSFRWVSKNIFISLIKK